MSIYEEEFFLEGYWELQKLRVREKEGASKEELMCLRVLAGLDPTPAGRYLSCNCGSKTWKAQWGGIVYCQSCGSML